MNVPVGKSTYAAWAGVLAAVIAAAIEAVQNGWSWQVVIMAALGAALLAINGAGRAYQAANPPPIADAISAVGFDPYAGTPVDPGD